MEYYLVLKKEEILHSMIKWMNLEDILLYMNWASQRKINTACFILVLHEVSKIMKFTELCKSGMMVARGWVKKKMGHSQSAGTQFHLSKLNKL